jgi:hypothetical protein
MTKILVAAFSLLLVAACNAQPGSRRAASIPNASHDRPLPVITVSGPEIRIDGTAVWLGDSLVAWKRALGGNPTCYDAGLIVTCVWHSNGLSLGTGHADKARVKFMLLDLAIEPPELGERAPSFPQSPFHGTLELDGIPISAKTEFRDLLRQVPPMRELRCGGSDCGNPSAAFSESASIYMSLAGRSQSSHILRFSISCMRTEACTALMPSQKKG